MTENTTDSTGKKSWKLRYRGGFLLGLGLVVAMFAFQRAAMNMTHEIFRGLSVHMPWLMFVLTLVYTLIPLGLIVRIHQHMVTQGRFRFASGLLHVVLLDAALWLAVSGQLYDGSWRHC